MQKKNFIQKLLRELSYRSKEGYPILSKKEHIEIISDILTEWGLSEIQTELLKNLTEGPDDEKYTHVGQGFYVKKGEEKKPDAQKFTKDDNGKYNVVSNDEYEKQKNSAGEEGGPTNNPNAKPKQDTTQDGEQSGVGTEQPQQEPPKGTSLQTPETQARYKKEKEAVDKLNREENRTYSKEDKKVISSFESKIVETQDFLTSEQYQLVTEALERIRDLYDENSSEELRAESAQWIIDNMKFSTNENGRKAYFNVLGGNRKIISGTQGTNSSENLVNKIKQYGEVKEFNAKGIKDKLAAAAKPDLGKENEASPKKHPKVKEFFQKNPILSRVKESMWGFFAVMDENGNPKMPSNEHSQEYLQQSFNNPALNRTIETSKELVKNGELDPKFVSALEEHQKRQRDLIEKYTAPNEELAKEIDESYNKMMTDLHIADSDAAGAVMKQLAENRLYETMLARGEEVYLPSNGSFPAGDVIHRGSTTGVSLISVKFGKSGRTYGCPANAKAIQSIHPDPNKREMTGQYLGEKDHLLVLKDDLYKGNTKEETIAKTKEFVLRSLAEIELSNIFTTAELNEYSTLVAEYTEIIENLKEELKSVNFPNQAKYWEEFNKRLAQSEKDYSAKMGKIMTEDKIAALIGKNNVGNAKSSRSGNVPVEVALCMINDANSIRTSDGFGLSHNKQYYDTKGEPHFVTDKGNNDPNSYSITYRTKRTAGRAGGGPQYSYTGDGDTADYELDDSGNSYDSETGESVD